MVNKGLIFLYNIYFILYDTVWIAYTEMDLDTSNCVIKRLWCKCIHEQSDVYSRNPNFQVFLVINFVLTVNRYHRNLHALLSSPPLGHTCDLISISPVSYTLCSRRKRLERTVCPDPGNSSLYSTYHPRNSRYRNFPTFLDTMKFAVITLKFEQNYFTTAKCFIRMQSELQTVKILIRLLLVCSGLSI